MAWRCAVFAFLTFSWLLGGQVWAGDILAKTAFGNVAGPSHQAPAAYGGYADGCLAGGVALQETGPGWQVMRLSRHRNWGHPTLIAFIERLSHQAQALHWPRLYIGDISQPRGGPMKSGHRSHQIGLDVDIWMRRPDAQLLTPAQRESISTYSVVAKNGRTTNSYWTASHHQLLRAAALDPAVARIFVNPAIKQQMCQTEANNPDRAWLGKIRPWWGHDGHFHVRLHCPAGATAGATGCVPQAAVPPGDGCDASLAWWFSDEALHPQPTTPAEPRRELRLSDLPAICRGVLEAP